MSDLTKDSGDGFLGLLETIGAEDAAGLKKAAESYGHSWKSRGGVGAFMMLARKWDRMQNRLTRGGLSASDKEMLALVAAYFTDFEDQRPPGLPGTRAEVSNVITRALQAFSAYDIFHAIASDRRAEGIIDDVRDLRRYLMLVEAEMRARGFDATHRDNKP